MNLYLFCQQQNMEDIYSFHGDGDEERMDMMEEEGGGGKMGSADNDRSEENKDGGVVMEERGEIGQTHTFMLRSRRRPHPILLSSRVRHKRQTMRSMTRPLKQWLYEHKDFPYPSRKEKHQLSADSSMTLIQVSNWFANARRRLKNTVQDPRLSWEQRIQKYNKHVQGNAERLSISSADSSQDELDLEGFDSDDDITVNYAQGASDFHVDSCSDLAHDDQAPSVLRPTGPPQAFTQPPYINHHFNHGMDNNQHDHYLNHQFDNRISDRRRLQTHKYKNSILQRYLNDSYEHARQLQVDSTHPANDSFEHAPELQIQSTRTHDDSYKHAHQLQIDSTHPVVCTPNIAHTPVPESGYDGGSGMDHAVGRLREGQGSVGSRDYEYLSTSPEPTSTAGNARGRQRHCSEELSLASSSDDWTSFLKDAGSQDFNSKEDEETYWQEILAAVALTNMARSRHQRK